MATTPDLFSTFASHIAASGAGPKLSGDLRQILTLETSGPISMVYAPFDHIEREAVLVLVGITPGRVQAENALAAARQDLREGMAHQDVLRRAKLAASFSGPMRANLVSMLDHVGVNRAFSVETSAELFRPAAGKVHFTSALRYPVFVDGLNYSGTPHMLRTPMLRAAVDRWLVEEVKLLPDALWLPLGPTPAAALDHLASAGHLARESILGGLPHPSGANAERISYFLNKKDRSKLSAKTNPAVLDSARQALRAQVAQFGRRA